MVWTNLLIFAAALGVSLLVVLLIHKALAKEVERDSVTKTILSMEVVAFGLLMAAFTLGEVSNLARTVANAPAAHNEPHFGLKFEDILLVFGSLSASLLIYIAAAKLLARRGTAASHRNAQDAAPDSSRK